MTLRILCLFLLLLSFGCKKQTVSFDVWLSENKNEKVVNLSNKELGDLPSSIETLEAVEELTLQYNSISKLPDELGNLKRLRILNLFGNPIRELPESLGGLQNLEILLLGRTEISSVPKFLPKLASLKTLALDETKLTLTEEDVEILAQIPKLEILDLTLLREFKTLPKNISKLSHLKELQVQKVLFEKSDVARLRDELPKVRVKL
ncbi:leucine-rich repeat domain-containing protein [Leptospira idonii]|uniref:Leucine-rich repeat domain-containing protein n=1 Tax=Leptospira idonii TaxID=1193500 RepID=A0A4R9LUM6_9LEPT|nr:leucine-rich repeat domain-containing protein [Leptospira idonii]TGN17592.1 leucine-rich repeat domain-containing protein [Leptospira idonii]